MLSSKGHGWFLIPLRFLRSLMRFTLLKFTVSKSVLSSDGLKGIIFPFFGNANATGAKVHAIALGN
jgi:hypothetical protein